MTTKRVTLKSRPGANGVTDLSHFAVEEVAKPTAEALNAGEVIVRTKFLSIDPAMVSKWTSFDLRVKDFSAVD